RADHAGGRVQQLAAPVRVRGQHVASGVVVAGGDDVAGRVLVGIDAGVAHGSLLNGFLVNQRLRSRFGERGSRSVAAITLRLRPLGPTLRANGAGQPRIDA